MLLSLCRWMCRACCCCCCWRWGLFCLAMAGTSPAFGAAPRMLVFMGGYALAPWSVQFLEVLRTSVREHHPDLELDVESVQKEPVAPSTADDVLPPWMLQKYAGKHYDIVIAGSAEEVARVVRLRDRLWPTATVVVPLTNEAQQVALKGLRGVVTQRVADSVSPTLALMFALLPQTRHVAVIASTVDNDPLRQNWRRSLAVLEGRARLIDLSGLPMEVLRQRVSSLPPDTALLFAAPGPTVGRVSTPRDLANELAGLANAPLFIDVSTLLDSGVLGGAVNSPEAVARDVGRQIERLLAGVSAEVLGEPQATPPHVVLNWEALQRWHIPASRVPPGSEVIGRPPGLWEAYRGAVLAGSAVVLVQAALIAALLIERRRRQRAELQARKHLAELARLNRGAALGALSAALAHEISQPLGAILSNAETAELLLQRPDAASRAMLGELLTEIREDDQRAAAVLSRLRAWIANTPGEPQPVALNPLVTEVARMLRTELQLRETELHLALAPGLPEVLADAVQMQQVVLNLVLNALEALQDVPARQRRIIVSTARLGHGRCEVSVRDSGPGLQGEAHERLFEPFFSTKPQGLGVGLAISRSIVELHRGRLRVQDTGEGACFSFTLPALVAPVMARAA